MSLTVKHAFTSPVPDDPAQAALGAVLPQAHWNAAHIITGQLLTTQLPTIIIRKPTSAATIPIITTDIEVGIDTRTTAVSITLPDVVVWATANPYGLELVIVDYYGNANVNNITPSLSIGNSFNYGGITPTITTNYGVLKLRPDTSNSSWIIRGIN